ncbi:MAG: hypothetical protein IPM85_02355 [Chitinophagaceae bacterium]|nr:hypothetical protein [Chitinophagaceae bacterium]
MKKIYALSLIGFISFLATAQTTTGGMKWKSVIGIDYIYSGEINNGKPYGKGLAIAVNGTVKIFGDFKNGLIEGNAFAFYNNGKIAIAKWKKGYANGPGVAIEKDGSLYYGTYVNGYMENKTIKIFNNNKIVIDHLKGSMSNGRAIVIEESGTIISDIVYENDLANGPGFQYEVDGKKKYEGFWENGKWLRAATTNHPSFIRSYNFGGMKTDKQIIMYSNLVNQSPRDTCFAYDIPSGYRYFGYFENGNMIRGIRIIGKMNTASGV